MSKIPKKSLLLLLFSYVIFVEVSALAEETLTITTYFPMPYASYRELTTTGDTYFVTSTDKVVGVGIGVGATAPKILLQVGTSPNAGLLVRTSGNTGIGITNPQGYRLRVEGNMTVTGKLDTQGTDDEVIAVTGFNGIIKVTKSAALMQSCTINVIGGIIINDANTTCDD
jgi:hypothetical protein